MGSWSSKLEVVGKHVYITGGSEGLGLEVAKKLAARGANVTIVSRSEVKLQKALEEVQAVASSKDQKIQYFVADVASSEQCKNAIANSVKVAGVPEIAMVGLARPGYFLEEDHISNHEQNIKVNYLGALYTAHVRETLILAVSLAGYTQ
ncbi:AP-1 complex subunit gamma-1 [Gonapodya sp. JEL0774]|nr:AP-1 complex subunit gamma-1 [Gonapodya sp. JEL0774]